MYRDVYGYYDTPCTTYFNIPTHKLDEVIYCWYIICILLSVLLIIEFINSIISIYEYCREYRKIKNKELSLAYVV